MVLIWRQFKKWAEVSHGRRLQRNCYFISGNSDIQIAGSQDVVILTVKAHSVPAIAENLGIKFGISLEQRINGAENVGAHKTSMLQDIEAGRATEIDAIVGAVAELGKLTQISTPYIDAIYASLKLLEATKLKV